MTSLYPNAYRFKRTLFWLLGQIHNLQIFVVISFIKLQNNIKQHPNGKKRRKIRWKAHLSVTVLESLFAGAVVTLLMSFCPLSELCLEECWHDNDIMNPYFLLYNVKLKWHRSRSDRERGRERFSLTHIHTRRRTDTHAVTVPSPLWQATAKASEPVGWVTYRRWPFKTS